MSSYTKNNANYLQEVSSSGAYSVLCTLLLEGVNQEKLFSVFVTMNGDKTRYPFSEEIARQLKNKGWASLEERMHSSLSLDLSLTWRHWIAFLNFPARNKHGRIQDF